MELHDAAPRHEEHAHWRKCGTIRASAVALALVLGLLLCAIAGAPSQCRASDWGFSWEIGAITAASKGTPFVFRLTTANSYSDEFSLGPSFYLSPYGDDRMYSGSLNAQFHFALPNDMRLSPFLGAGAVQMKSKNDSDSALFFPMGVSVDRRAGESLYLIGTVSFNLHGGIQLDGKKDDATVGVSVGIGYNP
jgi:hypothetical protein